MKTTDFRDELDNYFKYELKRFPLGVESGMGNPLPPQIGEEFFIVIKIKNSSDKSDYKEPPFTYAPWRRISDEERDFHIRLKRPQLVYFKNIVVEACGTEFAEIVDNAENKFDSVINGLDPGQEWTKWLKMKAVKAVEGVTAEPNLSITFTYSIDFEKTFTYSFKTGITEDIKPNFG